MFGTIALLLLIAAAAWFWVESLRVRETAVAACRQLCRAHEVQLLDDTIALSYLGPPRSMAKLRGRLGLRRVYQFEFSRAGTDRERGSVTMRGHDVEAVYLPSPPLEH